MVYYIQEVKKRGDHMDMLDFYWILKKPLFFVGIAAIASHIIVDIQEKRLK